MEAVSFLVGMLGGCVVVCLAYWVIDLLDERKERRRAAELAARIQPRDVPPADHGVNLFLDGLRYHIEREQRQKAKRDGGEAGR